MKEIYDTTQDLFVADMTSFEEAGKKEAWRKAMSEELEAIQKNEIWELVDLFDGKNVIGVK